MNFEKFHPANPAGEHYNKFLSVISYVTAEQFSSAKKNKSFVPESNIFPFEVKCESVWKIKDWIGIKQGDWRNFQ